MPKPDELALTEYQQIKTEQVARIGFRDNLIYVTLVAIAAALAISPSAHSRGYLLLVPAVTFVLGWTYLANDHMITAIGRYVRENPALPGMRWETDHPADKRRASRKAIQLAVDLATFCGSAAAALTAFWLSPGPQPPLLVLASAVEAITTGLLACQLAAYAGIRSRRQGTPKPSVVCLCGSTRYYSEFQQANYDLTMRGVIVLSVGFYPHAAAAHGHGEGVGHDSAQKAALDELHKRKIDLADEVLIVSDASGYFGESTVGEITYAVAHGKPVRFTEPAAKARAIDAGLITADRARQAGELLGEGAPGRCRD